MKSAFSGLKIACLAVCLVLCGAGCSGHATTAASDDAFAPRGQAGSGGQQKEAPAAKSKGPVVLGERLTPRQLIDRQQGGLVVGVSAAPEKWRYSSDVQWNYGNVSNPVTISQRFENPANSEAVYGYPALLLFYLRPGGSYYKPGQNYGGLIFSGPMSPLALMVTFIRQARANTPKLQFLGSKDLPDLPAALQIPKSPNQHGVGVKVTYELDGKPVEEEFYGVYDSIEIPYDGPQGRTYQINWGLTGLHSFRAPAGTLDQRRPVFAAIAKSFRVNPAWEQRHAAITKYLDEQFQRQLQAGYDAIAAAGRLSQQISRNNDEMIASIDHQLQSSRSSGGGGESGAGGRSAEDKFDDYIRGVDTTEDPYYGTSQHSFDEQFHWTDGYGNYRNTNDTTYDPNRTEYGNWTLMKSVP